MVDAYNDWRDERPDERTERRGARLGESRNEPRLDQRLDQWVSAGRQLVDGVSGARPGSRPAGRAGGLKLDHLGRWVEDKLDWLLEDEEGWRESWEQPQPRQQPKPQTRTSRREPLQAISRRQPAARSVALPDRLSAPVDAEGWPDDDSFSVSRWQRRDEGVGAPLEEPMEPAPRVQPGRAVPRSSRRRSD